MNDEMCKLCYEIHSIKICLSCYMHVYDHYKKYHKVSMSDLISKYLFGIHYPMLLEVLK